MGGGTLMGLLLIFGVGSALCLYAFAIHRCLDAIQPPKEVDE